MKLGAPRVRGLWPTRREGLAALASAALFAVAFPPFPFVVPAFLALVPIAVYVARAADEGLPMRSAARAGFWFGVLGYGCNLYWIAFALSLFTKLAILGYVASLGWLAPFLGLWAATLFAARRLTRWPLALLVPVTFAAHELLLNHLGDLAFPWLALGLSSASHPMMAQIADLGGVRTVGAWMACTAGLLADAWMLRDGRRAVVGRAVAVLAMAAAVLGYGAWRLRTTVLRPLASIAVVQPNIPEDEKLEHDAEARAANEARFGGILAAATRRVLATANPKLVVWPETALPGFLAEHFEWQDTLRALAAIDRAPMVFGSLDYTRLPDGDVEYFNAAFLADSNGVPWGQPAYHKGYLVPIVERVPFVNPKWFSGLKYFGGFGRGVAQPPFSLPFGRVGALICYESIFPDASRRFRNAGADVLVNITNDAWFGHSAAPYQHHAHLVLRAIENRVGVVRAANTGISGYIDPLGIVRDETPIFVPAERVYAAQTTDVRTLYVRVGDWIGGLGAALTLALLLGDRRGHRARLKAREAGTPVIPNTA